MASFKSHNVGPMNAGEVIKLPPFTEIQELSLDPVDAKFIESSKFDTSQIAAFYGVPPDMVGIWEQSKYNNVEQAQLNFRVNTIAAIARMYRQELEMKLLSIKERKNGKSIEFVTQALMELDVTTRTTYYKEMAALGVMTQNQIALLEGLPTFEGGNKHYMSSQVTSIEDRQNVIDVSTNNVDSSLG
jgi:HK97 family phage portal protein